MPREASIKTAFRQPFAYSNNNANGVCATNPPNIAMTTTIPVTNAIRCGENQREAIRMQLKKQNDAPAPTKNRPKPAIITLFDKAKINVPMVQIATANKSNFLVE